MINPFTRTFLVAWITLLDSIPDLELVAYLPRFLGGLFKFLSDPNQDVHAATQVSLDRFLNEIKIIARIKRGIAESRKSQGDDGLKQSTSSTRSGADAESEVDSVAVEDHDTENEGSVISDTSTVDKSGSGEDDWIPGQDVQVDHTKILDILVTFLSDSSGKVYLRVLSQI